MNKCAIPSCLASRIAGKMWCDKHTMKTVADDVNGTLILRNAHCRKIRQNDEWFCGYCHKVWPVDDENPPQCRVEREAAKKKK